MAKLIPLTRGMFAVVDDDLFDKLSRYKWHAVKPHRKFYAATSVTLEGVTYSIYMHRMVVGLDGITGLEVDHRDGDGLNNQKQNLRASNRSENMRNRGKNSNNTSGYKGVYFCSRTKRWRARIQTNGIYTHLGRFATPEAAAAAYDAAAAKLHGEFARLNDAVK